MGELIPVQPAIRLSAAVSLPVDFISTLALLYRAVPGAGLDPWLVDARRALPDETRYDLDILEGFSGRLLYFLEEPVTRFDPLASERHDATFVDLITFLADLTPDDYQAMAVRAVQRVRLDQQLDPTPPSVSEPGEGTGSAEQDLLWRRFLEPALTTATPDEVIPLLLEPERLRARTLDLFRTVWQTVYRDEYLRREPTLREAAELASGILYRGFGRVFSDVTDARIPATLVQRLHDVSAVTFHPSVHIGSFISYILSPPTAVIFFNAEAFMARRRAGPSPSGGPKTTGATAAVGEGPAAAPLIRGVRSHPDGPLVAGPNPGGSVPDAPLDREALIECARAIGDETRFRILSMLGEGEFYAQEIVSHLGIAQSAVSRHLALLERSGLVAVRPQRGMKYYSVDGATLRRFTAGLVAGLGR